MKIIYLEYVKLSENKYKFYELKLIENMININFGRIGSDGKFDIKKLDSKKEANKYFESMLKKKLNKGYKKAIKGLRPSLKGIPKGQLYFDFYKDY